LRKARLAYFIYMNNILSRLFEKLYDLKLPFFISVGLRLQTILNEFMEQMFGMVNNKPPASFSA
jgi:hypothetical protein